MKPLSRRHFLRGAGGAVVALPFLAAMEHPARAVTPPKRFIVFFTGLGQPKAEWVPTGAETGFELSEVLSPLAAHQDKLLVLQGIDMVSAYHGPGDPHQLGIGQALTATELLEGDLFKYACDPSASVGWGGGISVDQFIAQKVGTATKFPSLEFGVQVEFSNVSARMCYLGPAEPVPPEDNPFDMFARMFSDVSTDPRTVARLRNQRHHVLDAIHEDYAALQKRLGGDDRKKIEAHLDAISEIQQHLNTAVTLGGACKVPDIGSSIDIYANDNFPQIGKLQLDLLAMALACDMTRVASIQWATCLQGGKVFSWLGQSSGHHTLSHSGDGDTTAQQQLTAIGKWYAGQLAYLMNKLASIPEGDGTVLDNTLVFWCTDISKGNTHERRDMPYVLAGGAGGYFKTGRFLSYSGDPHSNLLVSICNAMDIDVTSFGNPAYCTGPLPRLTG